MKFRTKTDVGDKVADIAKPARRGLFVISLSRIGMTASQHEHRPDYLKRSFDRRRGLEDQLDWSTSRGSGQREMPLSETATPSLRKISVVDNLHAQSV